MLASIEKFCLFVKGSLRWSLYPCGGFSRQDSIHSIAGYPQGKCLSYDPVKISPVFIREASLLWIPCHAACSGCQTSVRNSSRQRGQVPLSVLALCIDLPARLLPAICLPVRARAGSGHIRRGQTRR